MPGKRMKVTIDVEALARSLRGLSLTAQTLSAKLGVAVNTAGKILNRMRVLGLAEETAPGVYLVYPRTAES